MNAKTFDNSVLLLGTAMMLVGFWFLNQSKFQNGFGDRGNPLAIVSKSNNTVKKKSALDLGWADALESEPLYTNDQVFTFEESTANVEFLSGASIQVAEKTLFKIQVEKGAINLDLTDGVIFAKISKKSGPLLVNIQNRQYKLESEEATVQLTKSTDSSEVLVVKGSAKISNAETSVEATENQKIEIKSSAQVSEQIQLVEVTPTAVPTVEPTIESDEIVQRDFPTWNPADGAVKIELKKPDQQVNFNWDGQEETNYQFELSDQADFQKVIITKNVSGPTTKVSFPKTGVFFWRAKQVDEQGNVTFQKPVKVIVKPTPPPSKPVLKKEIRLKIKENSSSMIQQMIESLIASAYAENRFVEIPMPEGEDAKAYLVEIYSDVEGKKLIKKGKTSETVYKFENPDAGNYWYRVSIIDYWDRESPFSDFSKMIVEAEPKKELSPKRSQITLISPVHGHKMVKKKITFRWKSDQDEDYIFELSDSVRFDDLKIRRIVRGNTISFERSELPERFYWRVKQGMNESYRRRVEVLKGIKPKRKIVKKRPVKKRFAKKLSRVGFSYRPTMTEYKTTLSSNQVTVDGTALNGVGLWYEKGRLDESGFFTPFYTAKVTRTAGEVFNTLGFSHLKTSLSYGDFLHYLPFQLTLIAELSQRSVYSVANSSVAEDSEMFFAGGVGLRYPFYLFSIQSFFQGSYTAGTSSQFDLAWNFQFPMKRFKGDLLFGFGIGSSDFDTELGTATLDETHLEMAYLMAF